MCKACVNIYVLKIRVPWHSITNSEVIKPIIHVGLLRILVLFKMSLVKFLKYRILQNFHCGICNHDKQNDM